MADQKEKEHFLELQESSEHERWSSLWAYQTERLLSAILSKQTYIY